MYEYAREAMAEAGYQQYEISNWCLTGYTSQHNLAYWRVQPYLGIGPGAHSNLSGFSFPQRQAAIALRWTRSALVRDAPAKQASSINEDLLQNTPTLEGYEAHRA